MEHYWDALEDISITLSKYFTLHEVRELDSVYLKTCIGKIEDLCETLVGMKKNIKRVKLLVYTGYRWDGELHQGMDFAKFELIGLDKHLRRIRMFLFRYSFHVPDYMEKPYSLGYLCRSMVSNIRKIKLGSSGDFDNVVVYLDHTYDHCFRVQNFIPEGAEENESERVIVKNRVDSFVQVPNPRYKQGISTVKQDMEEEVITSFNSKN